MNWRDTWTCTNCAMTYEDPAYLYCYQCGQARPYQGPLALDERIAELEIGMDTAKIHRMKLDARLRYLEDEDNRA